MAEWSSNGKRTPHFPAWDIETAVPGRVDVYLGTKWFVLGAEDVEHARAFARALLEATEESR